MLLIISLIKKLSKWYRRLWKFFRFSFYSSNGIAVINQKGIAEVRTYQWFVSEMAGFKQFASKKKLARVLDTS